MCFLFLLFQWYKVFYNEKSPPDYKFSTDSYVSPGERVLFIEEKDLEKFKNCKLEKISKIHDRMSLEENEDNKYIIEVEENWKPTNKNIKKLYKGFFFVENPSKEQKRELLNDSRVLKIVCASKIVPETRFSAGFVENGDSKFSFEKGYLTTKRADFNLTGEGEVVGVVDTGIDYRHPMFFDEGEFVFNKVNEKHRKIVFYDAWRDKFDNKPGHGTHTAAIIAGKANTGNVMPLYNGIAPESKLYFVDIENTADKSMYDNFDKEEFVKRLRSFGGGISSNSWGSPDDFGSSVISKVYDKVAYENQDILFLFAAGNHEKEYTIDAPASSKNVLTVGASDALPGQLLEDSETLIMESPEGVKFSLTQTVWSVPLWDTMQGEESMYNYSKFAVVSGNCDDALQAIQKGSKIVVSSAFETECKPTNNATVLIINNIDDIKGINSATFYPTVPEGYSEKKALFSSAGPSNSGIFKPEVIAPGVVLGPVSLSDSEEQRPTDASGLDRFQGTSEATPLVAGIATLLRQKLRKEKITPTSNLLRALIIAAADKETKTQGEGYGIPKLNKVLTNTIYANNVTIKGNSHLIAKFTATSNAPEVSISWMDPSITEYSPYPLYSHIDIVLESPSGTLYYKNYELYTTTKKLYARSGESGEWTIHLVSSPYEGTVNVAVAVVEATEGSLSFTETEECFKGCANCQKGICQCDDGKVGTMCSERVTQLNSDRRMMIFGTYSTRKLYSLKIPDLEKFEMSVKVEGNAFINLIQDSFDERKTFETIKGKDDVYTFSSEDYQELKAGNNISFVINVISQKLTFMVTFDDKKNPDPTPAMTPAKTASPSRPPMRTAFPENLPDFSYEGEDESSVIVKTREEKWIPITAISVLAFLFVVFIVLVVVFVVFCRRNSKIMEESTATTMTVLI